MEPTNLNPVYVNEQEDPAAVSLSVPQEAPDTGVSLSGPGPAPKPVPDNIAKERARKIQEGLGQHIQKSTEEIQLEIAQGREQQLRIEAASKMDYMRSQQKMQMLMDLSNNKGGPLDENEVNSIMDPFNPMNRPVNPYSVVERAYGHKYVQTVEEAIKTIPNTPIEEAKQEIPEEVEQSFLKGSVLTAKMEYAKKIRQDQEQILKNQSWLGWGADQAKTMFQPYMEAKLRGNTEGVGTLTGGLLLGTNLQEQADKVFGLPFEQYTRVLKEIVDNLSKDNPTLAHKFVSYVEGLSSNDRILDSAFSVMAPFDYATIGKGVLGLGRKISLANRTNKAMKDIVAAADRVGTDEGLRAEAAGDVKTASEAKASDLVLQNMNGQSNPIKIATDDTLLTFLNQDKIKIGSDKGNLTNTQVTKIMDQYDASGKGILQRIVDAARVNRIPMALATKNAVKILNESIKDYFPGIRNAILDVTNPMYEVKSNTYWHEVTFGNYGGRLFSNPDTAKNFAKINGMGDIRVVETHGPITPPQVERLLERKAVVENNIKDWEQTVIRRKDEAKDTKLTTQERATAKEQADGIQSQIKIAKTELDNMSLKLRGKGTAEHVAGLEGEVDLLRVKNKELRATRKNKDIDPAVREHIEASIKFGEDQVRAKAQEINAIKQGHADVIGSYSSVEQHGVGFKIVIRRPLTETDKAVRDLLIRDASGKLIPEATSTSSQTGFKSLMNAAVGKLRGADDTLALNENINRKIATYTQSLFKEWANQEAAYIKQIASGVIRTDPVTGETIPYWKAKPIALWNKVTLQQRRVYNEFVRVLDHARDALDPITGKPGYFFETPGELQNHYLKFYDRSPSFAEHEAYFAYVRIVEGDRILREISEFRYRARLGTEQFSLSVRGPDGKPIKSDFFDGRVRKEFPGGDEVLMIMGKKQGDEKLVNLGGAGISPKKLQEYRDAVASGKLRVIEVYAPEHKPLRDFSDIAGNEHVRYILTDASESKPIEFNHVNRRGGGHFEYDYDHYLKQASMYHQYEAGAGGRYKSVYTGDTTFMPLLNRVMGRDIADKMHTIQKLIRDGNLEDAKRFTQAHLPIEWDELHAMFKPGRDEKGKVTPPRLDLNEPFVITDRGKTILDMNKDLEVKYGKAFKDSAKSGSLNKQFAVAYNTERESAGLRHFDDIGTQGNPLYKYAPEDKMVDPITTMNRSLNRIVNSVFMDDYKIHAVEHWLREAETHLKADASSIHASPFWHFQDANDKSAFKSGAPKDVVANLLSNRYKIQQFVGVPNVVDTSVHVATQWLVDAAYQSFGPEAARSIGAKAITIVPLWMLAHIKDPVTVMRSLTFHAKLGLFAVPQLLVQAQTFATIISLSPFHGTAGTYATLLHQWSRVNSSPEMLKALDNMASKIGIFGQSKWRPGEFMEARQALNSTGFEKVAGEYANLNTAMKTDFVGNDIKDIANAGTWFFREGEKSTRLGAWYTAFREFREANPTGALSKTNIGSILQRADLLTVNMSRASNSMLHGGVLSLTTQFLTYQLRLAELFMGTRLAGTSSERAMARLRMVTFYSALYGAPSAVGLTGLPLANSIRQEAMERGYTVGENFLSTLVDQGLPAMTMAFVTGGGDWKKGNNYNFGDRFGSPGFTQLTDALKSDTPWWKLLAGASGTTILNTLTQGNNFFHVIASQAFASNKDKPFPLKLDDFVDVFKEITSVNQTWKLIAAINTGKWMSKNEGYIGDVTKANAAFMAMTGLNPQQQDDSYIKSNIRKEEIAFQKDKLKEFIQEYRRGIQATKNNPNQAADYYKRAFTLLEIAGYPADKTATAIAIATKGYESQIQSQDFDFAFKGVPKTKSGFMGIPTPFNTQTNVPDTRREQFRTQQQINTYKDK